MYFLLNPGECCNKEWEISLIFKQLTNFSKEAYDKNKPEILPAAFVSLVPDLNVELIR